MQSKECQANDTVDFDLIVVFEAQRSLHLADMNKWGHNILLEGEGCFGGNAHFPFCEKNKLCPFQFNQSCVVIISVNPFPCGMMLLSQPIDFGDSTVLTTLCFLQ